MNILNIIRDKFIWLWGLEKYKQENNPRSVSQFECFIYFVASTFFIFQLIFIILNGSVCFSKSLDFSSTICANGVLFGGVSFFPGIISLVCFTLNFIFLIISFFKTGKNNFILYAKILEVFGCLFFVFAVVFLLAFPMHKTLDW